MSEIIALELNATHENSSPVRRVKKSRPTSTRYKMHHAKHVVSYWSSMEPYEPIAKVFAWPFKLAAKLAYLGDMGTYEPLLKNAYRSVKNTFKTIFNFGLVRSVFQKNPLEKKSQNYKQTLPPNIPDIKTPIIENSPVPVLSLEDLKKDIDSLYRSGAFESLIEKTLDAEAMGYKHKAIDLYRQHAFAKINDPRRAAEFYMNKISSAFLESACSESNAGPRAYDYSMAFNFMTQAGQEMMDKRASLRQSARFQFKLFPAADAGEQHTRLDFIKASYRLLKDERKSDLSIAEGKNLSSPEKTLAARAGDAAYPLFAVE